LDREQALGRSRPLYRQVTRKSSSAIIPVWPAKITIGTTLSLTAIIANSYETIRPRSYWTVTDTLAVWDSAGEVLVAVTVML
jgi:hypothetical protein